MKRILSRIYQGYVKKKCKKNILPFKNTASGRCFIIGNGPSLTPGDLDRIKKEVTFASNRIFGIFDRTEWRPTFYVSQDDGVLLEIKDHLHFVSQQVGTMFLNGNMMRAYPRELTKKKNVKFIYMNPTFEGKKEMDINISDGIHNVINVSYTMIELAIYMGYTEIFLLGIDHHYVTKKNKEGETVLDGNSSDNYFRGITPLQYEAKVKQKDISKLMDESTEAYQNALSYAKEHNIMIYNATRGGYLEVFERINFDDIPSLKG